VDRFDAMRLFTRVVERRNFSQAATDLALPRSTATSVIQQLEQRLGVRLLQRTTRTVRPTLDGEAYYRRCLVILDDVENAEGALRGTDPRGLLRVDVHGTLARHFLLPGLPQFLKSFPGLELHMTEGDRLADLIREGIDCVLRVGTPRDSDMIMRRVAMLDEVTLAAPSYLAEHGMPASIADLNEGHRMVGFQSSATGTLLPLQFALHHEIRSIALPATMSLNGAESYVAAAKLGLGIAQLPRYHVDAALASGALVELLPDHPPPPTPVSLLYPSSRQLAPRVRLFMDWAARQFETQRSDQTSVL